MASVLHGSARTTPRIRAELKAAQAPARLLASQYGLNVKTVLEWRNRDETTDAPMGPKSKSTVLTSAAEAVIVEFWHRTLLPLDDVLAGGRLGHGRTIEDGQERSKNNMSVLDRLHVENTGRDRPAPLLLSWWRCRASPARRGSFLGRRAGWL
jgi:hypothetical protein